jgi:hypothetical protein
MAAGRRDRSREVDDLISIGHGRQGIHSQLFT